MSALTFSPGARVMVTRTINKYSRDGHIVATVFSGSVGVITKEALPSMYLIDFPEAVGFPVPRAFLVVVETEMRQ